MTVLIDYGAGNIRSVENALHFLSEDSLLTSDPDAVLRADHIILPGVGAFGDVIMHFWRRDYAFSFSFASTGRGCVKTPSPCLFVYDW